MLDPGGLKFAGGMWVAQVMPDSRWQSAVFARDGRNADHVIATGALDLSSGKLFVASQVLLAMGALKFEVAHWV